MSADHMLRTACVPTARVATRWWPGAWVTSGAAWWRWWAWLRAELNVLG